MVCMLIMLTDRRMRIIFFIDEEVRVICGFVIRYACYASDRRILAIFFIDEKVRD